jgi:acetyltransferase-like isoleucine patch superfamily enzyme
MKTTFYARWLEHTRRASSALRITCARATGVRIGSGCRIGPGCDLALGIAPPRRGAIELADGCELTAGVILHPYGGRVRLGLQVHLGPGTVVYGHGGVVLGDRCLVAMHCRILSSNHAIPPLNVPIRSQPDVLLPTNIGSDVWLGAGVTVLGGVTIGDGCIVGAGSVVTRDLPPGAIAYGVPAVIERNRPDPSASRSG